MKRLSHWWHGLDTEQRVVVYGPLAMVGTSVWIVLMAVAFKYAGVE